MTAFRHYFGLGSLADAPGQDLIPARYSVVLIGWRDTTIDMDLSQALAKLERGHERDLCDVASMMERGLIEEKQLNEMFLAIEPELIRFPAIDPAAFRERVEKLTPR